MALLTTFCGECRQVALSDQQHLLNGRLPCPLCGANLRVLPGCSFGENDRPLFDDLKQVVAESHIVGEEARRMAAQIAGALAAGGEAGLLERLTVRLPGLLPIQTTAALHRPERQRALKILRAILEATASVERG